MRISTICSSVLLLALLTGPAVGEAKAGSTKADTKSKPKKTRTRDWAREKSRQAARGGRPGGEECSKKCYEQSCDSFGIKYGKYCGVTHTGCAGEEPCDDVDRCCMAHDHCVGRAGVFDTQCHSVFISCVSGHLEKGRTGFSETCPYEKVVPVMKQGIEMTMAFTGGMKTEL